MSSAIKLSKFMYTSILMPIFLFSFYQRYYECSHHFTLPRLYPIWCLAVSCIIGIWWQSLGYPWYCTLMIAVASIVFLLIWRNRCLAFKTVYVLMYGAAFLTSCLSYQAAVIKQEEFCKCTHAHSFNLIGTVTDISQTGNVRLPYALKLDTYALVCTDAMLKTISETSICLYTKTKPTIAVSDIIEVKNIRLKRQRIKNSCDIS